MKIRDRADRDVTIAVCTWNRAQLLRSTLECMRELFVPDGLRWEVLVVNNNSPDATEDVIASFRGQLPIRSVIEHQPGLTAARCRALAEARGEYMVWTDDDVLVDSQWLAAYIRAFSRWPATSFFGGPIEPWFEDEPPEWVTEALGYLSGAYAMRHIGEEEVALTEHTLPFGANMAMKTSELRRSGFDLRYGYIGESVRTAGEEERAMLDMMAHGATGRWVPAARVRHFIPRRRMTTDYVRDYFIGRGELMYAEAKRAGNADSMLTLAARAAKLEMKYRIKRVTSSNVIWVDSLGEASFWRGQLRACRAGRSRLASAPGSD